MKKVVIEPLKGRNEMTTVVNPERAADLFRRILRAVRAERAEREAIANGGKRSNTSTRG